MLYGIVCFAIGFLCGVVLTSLMALAGHADEQHERPWWGRGL